jgi:trans-aconitate methyltransferase
MPPFHADPRRLAPVSDFIVSAIADRGAALRILDIGCGTGDQIFDLASRLPAALFTGVDVERSNIAVARQRLEQSPDRARITFVAADYREFRAAPFDVVCSFSALYVVGGGAVTLAERVADDVVPGGVFINIMPCRCLYNQLLAGGRRMLRTIKSPTLDAWLLKAASRVHPDVEPGLLAERVQYVYVLPLQYEDDVAEQLEQRGFTTVRREAFPHASLAQLKHAGRIMRRKR